MEDIYSHLCAEAAQRTKALGVSGECVFTASAKPFELACHLLHFGRIDNELSLRLQELPLRYPLFYEDAQIISNHLCLKLTSNYYEQIVIRINESLPLPKTMQSGTGNVNYAVSRLVLYARHGVVEGGYNAELRRLLMLAFGLNANKHRVHCLTVANAAINLYCDNSPTKRTELIGSSAYACAATARLLARYALN